MRDTINVVLQMLAVAFTIRFCIDLWPLREDYCRGVLVFPRKLVLRPRTSF